MHFHPDKQRMRRTHRESRRRESVTEIRKSQITTDAAGDSRGDISFLGEQRAKEEGRGRLSLAAEGG